MTWRETLRTAAEAVRSHRLRSALTMLGILIGITAVVLSIGISAGAQQQVQSQIAELGTNVLVVSPGSSTSSSGVRGGFGSSSTLTMQDAGALGNSVAAPDIQAVAAASTTEAELVAGSTNWTSQLMGTTPSYAVVRSRSVRQGRFITQGDVNGDAAVVVLGSDTASQLFSFGSPIGQTVTYNGATLQVVGVLSALSSTEDASANDIAIVPYTTYQQQLVGGNTRNAVSSIYIKATSADTLSAAYQEADALLLNLHHITSSSAADFSIATQASLISAASTVNQTMSLMLAGIAVISLLVGGIGVMNIMLVSVTERIREIGLRKSLGARRNMIRRQFLVEASGLGFAGGVLGVAVAVLAAILVPHFTGTPIVLSVGAGALAIVVSIGIGVLFGVYPATRAARLAPIDALRSE